MSFNVDDYVQAKLRCETCEEMECWCCDINDLIDGFEYSQSGDSEFGEPSYSD